MGDLEGLVGGGRLVDAEGVDPEVGVAELEGGEDGVVDDEGEVFLPRERAWCGGRGGCGLLAAAVGGAPDVAEGGVGAVVFGSGDDAASVAVDDAEGGEGAAEGGLGAFGAVGAVAEVKPLPEDAEVDLGWVDVAAYDAWRALVGGRCGRYELVVYYCAMLVHRLRFLVIRCLLFLCTPTDAQDGVSAELSKGCLSGVLVKSTEVLDCWYSLKVHA